MGLYIFAGQSFSSVEATRVCIANKLKKLYDDNDVLIDINHPDFDCLLYLLYNHPKCNEKIGVGVNCFKIHKNSVGNGLELLIIRVDDTIDSFSYKKCITGKDFSKLQITKNAMRSSILPQLIEFKTNSENVCNLCKTSSTKYEIDHSSPTFNELVNLFMIDYPILPLIFAKNNFNQDTFLDDCEYKKNWEQYHKDKANLQLLCIPCHREKGRQLYRAYASVQWQERTRPKPLA